MSPFIGAVIGCGRMGAFTSPVMRRHAPATWLPLSHAEGMAGHPDVQLDALCDIDDKALSRAQERFRVTKGYTDYRLLLRVEKPQILGIATRTPQRFDIISCALEVGTAALHVEKPLCSRLSDLEQIQRSLAEKRVICTYGTLRRYFPVYHRARELALSGRFGTLEQVVVCFGVGTLMWTHPHSLDLLSFMASDSAVEWIMARFSEEGCIARGAVLDGDPTLLSATLKFSNGVTGLISQVGGWDVTLACSNGTVTVEADGRRIRCRSSDGDDPYWDSELLEETSVESGRGGTRIAIERLVRGLRGEECDPQADRKAMLSSQRLLFACAQSHLEGGKAVDPRHLDSELAITGRSPSGAYA